MNLGLARTGWKCVYANDIDPKKKEMFECRFPKSDYYHLEDIWERSAILGEISKPALMATASFPCTDLSTAGHYRGLKGKQSSTFFGFLDVLEVLKTIKELPPIVLIENVPGLLTSNSGQDFQQVAQSLAALGYFLDAIIIDAKYFTPQSRPRLFIVGALKECVKDGARRKSEDTFMRADWEERVLQRKDICPPRLHKAMLDTPLCTDWLAYEFPPLPRLMYSLEEVIDLDEVQDWWDADAVSKHMEMMSDSHRKIVEELTQSQGVHIGTIYRRKRHGGMRAEVRFDGLAGCLRTPKGGSARQIVIVIDNGKVRMRWMSAREYARLQGAADFPIIVPAGQAMFGFADGVCVPVIEWLDKNLLSPLAMRALKNA